MEGVGVEGANPCFVLGADHEARQGGWSERVARSFQLLVTRACRMDCRLVHGIVKPPGLRPGESLLMHNHCWNAVNIGTQARAGAAAAPRRSPRTSHEIGCCASSEYGTPPPRRSRRDGA